jgi:DNA-binding NarL/FixJ family response regulator
MLLHPFTKVHKLVDYISSQDKMMTFQPAAEQSRDMENLTKRAREMLELMAKGDRYLV